MEPAFRLPVGGRALAGPLLDAGSPASAWLLSEDGALYVLTENGTLSTRILIKGQPSPYLALDPFGRALVLVDGTKLEALTRSGTRAYSVALSTAPAHAPAFGSDGRAFIVAGREMICLNPAGKRLWSYPLPVEAACPPSVDALGRPVLGLVDGSISIFTPYGEVAASIPEIGGRALSPARSISPMAVPEASGTELPCLAAALSDGTVLFLGAEGAVRAQAKPAPGGTSFVDLAWDGAILYTLDASGRLAGLSAAGKSLWTAETYCVDGRISLFAERVVVAARGRAVSLSTEGQSFREVSVVNSAARAVVSPAGLLFTPGQDWVLAAYRFEAPLGLRRGTEHAAYTAIDAGAVASEALFYDPMAGDSDRQLARLDDIEKSLRSGSIGKDEVPSAAYCAAVALRAFEGGYPDAERRFRGNPLPRARACVILGELGSPGYRAALSEVLARDPDPAVRAAACDALAEIGVDPDGRSAAAFLAAARTPVDERTALGLVAAIERMALRSGSAPGPEAVRTLLALAAKPYGNAVRDRASAALGRIAGVIAP